MIQSNCIIASHGPKHALLTRYLSLVLRFAVLNLSYDDRSQALALAHMYEASMRAICGTRRNG